MSNYSEVPVGDPQDAEQPISVPFEQFIRAVSRSVERRIGLSADDLPDFGFMSSTPAIARICRSIGTRCGSARLR